MNSQINKIWKIEKMVFDKKENKDEDLVPYKGIPKEIQVKWDVKVNQEGEGISSRDEVEKKIIYDVKPIKKSILRKNIVKDIEEYRLEIDKIVTCNTNYQNKMYILV